MKSNNFPGTKALLLAVMIPGTCLALDRAIYFDNTNALTSTDTDTDTTASAIAPGAFTTGDFGPSTNSGGSYFVRSTATGSTTDLATAITNNTYLEFSVTVDSGTQDLSSITFDQYGTNISVPYSIAVMSNVTGFTAGSELATFTTSNNTITNRSVVLSDAAFKGLAPASEVTFRLYFFDSQDVFSNIQRVKNIRVKSVDPIMIVDPTGPNTNLTFGAKYGAVPITFPNRTLRYKNTSTTNDIQIENIALTDDGGGVFQIVSTSMAPPFALAAGATFDVTVSASSSSISGAVAGSLFIDTDENTAENPQDKTVAVSASFFPPGYQLLTNPTFDSNRNGWDLSTGSPRVTPGILGPDGGGVRLQGEGDLTGAQPDHFGQLVPSGAADWELAFWMTPMKKDQIERYTTFEPDGQFLDRSFQVIILGNEAAFPTNGGVWDDTHAPDALINLAYFPDGLTTGGTEGFYAFDSVSGWQHLPALGTLPGSIDAEIVPGDKGDGILDATTGDTVNAHLIRIKGSGFGAPGASFSISVSDPNSVTVSGGHSVSGLTLTNSSASINATTPAGIVFTTGDKSNQTGIDAFGAAVSFWIDDTTFYSSEVPDPSITASPSPLVISSHNGAPVVGTITVTNAGFSADLDLTSASFSPATGYSTTAPSFPANGISPGDSVDVDVSVNTASFGTDTAGLTDLTLVNSTGVDEIVPVEWGSTTDSQLIANWDFEVAGRDQATDSDSFAIWDETSPADVLDVPGLNPGSTTAAYIRRATGNGVNTTSLGADAENFRVEYYFAVKAPVTEPNGADPGTRQFNALLMSGENGFQVNLRYLKLADGTGDFQCFEAGGPGWQSVGSLPSTTALAESIDINSDGDLDAGGSTKNVYRLVLDVTGMGTAGASYDFTVFDTDDTSVIASSTGNTIFQTAAFATTLPTSMIRFTSANSSCSSFWVDDVTVSNVAAGPDVKITSVSGGPGSFTINWSTDPMGASVRVLLSTDGMQTFNPIDTGNTSGSFTATGAEAPAGKAFYRVETE